MAFNPNKVDLVDQDEIEEIGLRFPGVIYMNGNPKMAPKKGQPAGMSYRGGFFISDEALPGKDLAEYGWEEESFVNSKNKTVTGWYRHDIELLHIVRRRRWTVQDAAGNSLYFAWPEWEKAKAVGHMRSQQQSIVIIRGLEVFGPFCFTLSGYTQILFNGENEFRPVGCLSRHNDTIIAKANEETKKATPNGVKAKRWDHWAFWLKVAAAEKNGVPVFNQVGQGQNTSMITYIEPLDLPATMKEVTQEILDAAAIDDDHFALVAEAQATLKANQWKEAWKAFVPVKATKTEGEELEEADKDYASAQGF